jgi:hypothetical protein
MPCNASYARFIFGKFFTSTIILYALLFAQKFYSCKKWVLQAIVLGGVFINDKSGHDVDPYFDLPKPKSTNGW